MYFIDNNPGLYILITAISCNFLAQLYKFFAHRITDKEWNYHVLFTTGGTPSSHTALVIGTLFAIGITDGINSVPFASFFVFTTVVLHDAMGVRRHAGKQAEMLNIVVQDMKELSTIVKDGGILNNEAYSRKFKELLGHEPIEVVAGVIFGVLISTIIYFATIYFL